LQQQSVRFVAKIKRRPRPRRPYADVAGAVEAHFLHACRGETYGVVAGAVEAGVGVGAEIKTRRACRAIVHGRGGLFAAVGEVKGLAVCYELSNAFAGTVCAGKGISGNGAVGIKRYVVVTGP
jgi:hypothetical protein